MGLYARGYTVTEISRIYGVAKSTVSTTLKQVREGARLGKPERTGLECPHSPSCFTCPMADCVVNAPERFNTLPLDFEYMRAEAMV